MKSKLIKPLISEKTVALAKQSKFTFIISNDSRKEEIKRLVESIYNVNVVSVNTSKIGEEIKKGVYKGSSQFYYKKPSIKKAIVTLKAGQMIEYFDFKSEAEKKEEAKQAKKTKKSRVDSDKSETSSKSKEKSGLLKRISKKNK